MLTLILTVLAAAADPFEQLSDPAFVAPSASSAPVQAVAEPVTPQAESQQAAVVTQPAQPPLRHPSFSLFNAARLPMDRPGIGLLVGWAGLEGNQFLQLTPLLRLHGDSYALELGAPVNLTLSAPNDPAQRMWSPRRYDWDEWRDYLKILRELRLGSFNDDGNGFAVEAGRLDGVTLRQGGLVRRYSNNLLADTTRTSLGMRGKSDSVAGQIFLSDATWESPLLAMDLGLTPFSGSSNRVLSSFEFGASYALELFTPVAYRTDEATGVRQANVQRTPQTTGRALHGFTADLGLAVVNFQNVRLKLFGEFGALFAFGNSIAAGVDLELRFGMLSLGARGEYRNFSDKWIPGYFGAFHEVERLSFLSSRMSAPAPKFAVLDAGLTSGARVHGGSAELRLALGSYLQVLGAIDLGGYDVAQQFVLHVQSQPLDWLTVFATYQKRNYVGFSELFRFTDTDMLRSGLSVAPLSWLMLTAYAGRSFIWSPAADSALGNVVGTWSFGASLGARYAFGD